MRRKREVTYFGRAPILAGALALAWLERLLVDSRWAGELYRRPSMKSFLGLTSLCTAG